MRTFLRIVVGIIFIGSAMGGLVMITEVDTTSDIISFLVLSVIFFIIGYKLLFKKKKNTPTQSTPMHQVSNQQVSNNVNKDYFTLQAENNVRIFNDCYELIQSTKNIDTFFMRYELGLEKINLLKQAVEMNTISLPNLTETTNNFLNTFQNRKEEVLTETINSEYDRINKLKTPKGRHSNWSKLLENIKKYQKYYSDSSKSIYIKHMQFINNEILNNNVIKNKEQTQGKVTSLSTNNSVETSIQYIEDGNVIYHTDGSDIEDSEIPYLIQLGLSEALERERTSPNPKWHRTREEKELKFQFLSKNYDYLQEQMHIIIDVIKKANETITDVDVTISDCKKAIQVFYDLKKFCYQTEGGKLYFQDMWEHCHNSQNPCFCFIEKTEQRLQDLTENYAERKRYYEKRQYAINHLKNDLLTLISNHENILQKDVYSHFDADLKDNVARMLYDMDKKGEIKRIKHGSTYQLSIK